MTSVPVSSARDGRRAGIGACLVLALVARVAAVFLVNHPELRRGAFELGADEPSFHNTAVALATTGRYDKEPGGPPTAFRPPLAVLPLAAAYLVAADPRVGVGVVMLVSLGGVVVAAWLAAGLSDDPRVPTVAAFLAATMPTLVFVGSAIWSEPQAILLTLFVLGLLVRGWPATHGPRGCAVVGLLLACAYLTRQSAGFLLPVVVAGAWRASPPGRRMTNLAALLFAFLIPVGTWALRNRVTLGETILSATVSGQALWGSNNPVTAGVSLPAIPERNGVDLAAEAREGWYLGSWVPMRYIPGWVPAGSELEAYHRQVASTRAFVRDRPGAWLRLLGYKMLRMVTLESYAPSIAKDVGTRRLVHRAATLGEYWFVLIAGGSGLLLLRRARPEGARWCVAFFAAGVTSVLVTYPNPRFVLPATTVLLAPAAVALLRASDALGLTRRRAVAQPPFAAGT